MNLKHVNNIIDGTADLLIYDNIGESMDEKTGVWSGISGTMIAQTIQMLNEHSEVKQINVRINSSGGSVLDGYSIFMAIKNSKKPVHTFIDGVGASIAGIIFQAGDVRHIVDFGRLMIHDPSGGTAMALMNQKQRNMLESFRDSLLTILNNNSSTLSNTDLDQMMANETWINPTDAIEMGFADKVIKTDRFSVVNEATTTEEIMAICNTINKSIQMKDLKNHLAIGADSTETQIIENVKAIQNDLSTAKTDIVAKTTEIETLTNQVSEKDVEIAALKAAESANTLTVATMHVENAIAKGIFDVSKKAELIKQCENNVDGFVALVGNMKSVPVKVMNQIAPGTVDNTVSLRDLEKSNPSEIQRLINQEPEVYAIMYKKQYGVDPS